VCKGTVTGRDQVLGGQARRPGPAGTIRISSKLAAKPAGALECQRCADRAQCCAQLPGRPGQAVPVKVCQVPGDGGPKGFCDRSQSLACGQSAAGGSVSQRRLKMNRFAAAFFRDAIVKLQRRVIGPCGHQADCAARRFETPPGAFPDQAACNARCESQFKPLRAPAG